MGTKKAVSIVDKTAVVNLNSPKALSDFSKELKKFIVENELYTTIQGKNFVHVEGWQFAGASMGIFPIVVSEENLSPENKNISYTDKYGKHEAPVYKYKSRVELVQMATGKIIGSGVALCSNEEKKKNSFDEYAVLSMAQTRATGKAFRMTIGWIMKLAGYEPTPAEEITKELIEQDEEETISASLPLDDMKMIVDIRLNAMSVTDKMKFMKDFAGVITEKSLDDTKYKLLYDELWKMKIEKEKEE